jgi:branched-chain amino acid transport system ATP-binding protein
MKILEVIGVSKYFGGLAAISNLSFHVNSGEILGLIGPNGAGKTTVFNVITGVYRPSKGTILFKGNDIKKMEPHAIAKQGIARTFQSTILYHEMSVLENVMVGDHLQTNLSFLGAMVNSGSYRESENLSEKRSLEIIDFLGLSHVKDDKAENLPHGHQRKLGVGIALMTNPELLLLDEPVTGMNSAEIEDMTKTIRKIQVELGTTIVVIEHHMKALMELSTRVVAVNYGQMIAEGIPQEIKENQAVIEAYLGKEEEGEI